MDFVHGLGVLFDFVVEILEAFERGGLAGYQDSILHFP